MITPLISSLYATNLAHTSAARMFNVNQAQMALANSVTGNESPGELMRIQRMEKALMFQGIQAQVQFQAAQLMQESAQKMQKQNNDLKRRLMDNGAVFV